MLQLILAMFIWGTLGLVVLKSELNPIDIAFYRCLVGLLGLAPYCWYKGYFTNNKLTLKVISLIAVGGIFVVLNWILLFQSFKFASITVGNVSYYIQPVFLVALGSLVFKEKVSFLKWLFILLTMCGVYLTMNVPLSEFHLGNTQLLGVGCALAAGLFYSFATIIAKDMSGIPPTMTTLIQLGVGTIVLLPFLHATSVPNSLSAVIYFTAFGTLYTVVAFSLYYKSITLLTTSTIAVISYIDPVVAILTDIAFFNKELSMIQTLGILLTLISSYCVINSNKFSLAKKITMNGTHSIN